MPRCGHCSLNREDADFDRDIRGALRRTCRRCLVCYPIQFLLF